MAKICQQCGVKYKNSATQCVMCGTEFQDIHVGGKGKMIRIFGILGALLVVAMVVIMLLFTGPKAAARRVMEGYKRNDAEAVIACFPSFFMESDELNRDGWVKEIEYNVKDMSDYIFSYTIEKAEKPSSQDRERFMEDFHYFGGDAFDENKLQDVRVVWVIYKGNIPGVWPSRGARLVMIKYEGRWYWWPDTINR